MERPCQAPTGSDGFLNQAGFPPQEGSRPLVFRSVQQGREVFPPVGFEQVWFGTAGPMTAQEQTRRLITLIFAGRNRRVMIRRELPRTEYAGWVLKPFRTEDEEGSPFRGPCAVIGSAVQ